MCSQSISRFLMLLGLAVLSACAEGMGAFDSQEADASHSGTGVPPAPADCRAAKGESAYWFELKNTAEGGPRMAELVVRHPEGVVPAVSGLDSLKESQKALHLRSKGRELTRIVILSSDNLNPVPPGPVACVKVPEGSQLSFVRSQSGFAPARFQADSEQIELWPVEVK